MSLEWPEWLVDLTGLASKQAASTREMGKNHSSIVVLRIRPKFWWMLPMGVRDNHTRYEPETQRWRPGTGIACAGPPFQHLQFRAKMSLVPKGPPGPSNSTICPRTAPKGPQKPQNLCTMAADSPKPKTDHILGYVAQNAISRAPNPPATTHFWWFPSLKIALTDA